MAFNMNETLNQLRLDSTCCDVVLKIGSKSFLAHRVVLMGRLEYFKNILTSNLQKKKKILSIALNPQIVDSTFFEEILNYIYTSKIDLTNENIRAIYKAANHFRFDELTNKVEVYMERNMSIENIVSYKKISNEFGMKALEKVFTQFIHRNLFSGINKGSREKLIPSLSFDDLNEILQNLKQGGNLEEMFYYSVDWVQHHKPNSIDNLLELLKNIPLEDLSFEFLKQVVSQTDLIRKSIECLNLFVYAFITASNRHDTEVKECSKIDMKESDFLYAIGGRDGGELLSVSKYNSTTGKWSATTPMPSPRTHFGCAVIGKKIYVCGGHDGNQNMKDLTVFDTDTKTWTQLKPMKHGRQQCGVAVINENIYVAGGFDSGFKLTVVERYNVQTDQWEDVAPMTTKRFGLELIELNEHFYAIGGCDGSNDLKSVERYDLQTDQWTPMNNMSHNHVASGSTVLNGNIYIVGSEKCEMYDSADDKWTEMPAPSEGIIGRRLATFDGKLYAIGGRTPTQVDESSKWKGIKTVEVFDFEARVWRTEPDMDVARCYHGVAVVRN